MKKILLFLPFFILLSCSVQKRKYQKGFYVSWKHGSQKEKAVAITEKDHVKPVEKPVKTNGSVQELPVVAAVNSEPTSAIIQPAEPLSVFKKDEPCDELVFKDGTEQKAKIMEISTTEIKYKKCDLPDGPLYVVKKSELFMVKYANGTREVFKSEPDNNNQRNTYKNKPYSSGSSGTQENLPLASVSFVMGLLSVLSLLMAFAIGAFIYILIPLAITAIITGGHAIRKIRGNPDLYRGEGLARAGRIMGFVALSVVVLLFLLVVLLIALFI